LEAAWVNLTTALQKQELPDAMQVQFMFLEYPGKGKVFGIAATWSSGDVEQGRIEMDKLAALGLCISDHREVKTPTQYLEDNDAVIPYGVYGRCFTLSIKKLTLQTAAVLAKYSSKLPSPSSMLWTHALRRPIETVDSVFGGKTAHLILDICAFTHDKDLEAKTIAWGRALQQEVRDKDGGNVLDNGYLPLMDTTEVTMEKMFHKHLPTVRALKTKYDPENIFRYALPQALPHAYPTWPNELDSSSMAAPI
jgi:hypothetical protein